MERKTKFVVGGAVAAMALAAGTGIAIAGGEDENEGPDVPISGDALDQAERAALAYTGEGTSPRPRSATRRACTRWRSPSTTGPRSTCSWTRTSPSSAASTTEPATTRTANPTVLGAVVVG